jgi:hypothetical protein
MHHYFKILFIYLFIYLFIHLFGSSEVSILSFVCARKVLYYLNNASSHFCFGYFWDRILIFAWVSLECDLSMYTCCLSWDDRCAPSCLIFPLEIGFCKCFTWADLEPQSFWSLSLEWATGTQHKLYYYFKLSLVEFDWFI